MSRVNVQEPEVWLLHPALCGPAGHECLCRRDHAEGIPGLEIIVPPTLLSIVFILVVYAFSLT